MSCFRYDAFNQSPVNEATLVGETWKCDGIWHLSYKGREVRQSAWKKSRVKNRSLLTAHSRQRRCCSVG